MPLEPDHETLRLAVEEARREYEAELSTLEEIDDKALRSVRTAVIVVGLVVSAVGVAGPASVSILSIPEVAGTALAILLLMVTIISGIATATVSEYPSGVGTEYRAAMLSNAEHRKFTYKALVDQYNDFTDEVADEVAANESLLSTVQFSLAFGIYFLVAAAGSLVVRLSTDLGAGISAVTPIVLLTAAFMLAGQLTSRSS
jgi:hypothetical protein